MQRAVTGRENEVCVCLMRMLKGLQISLNLWEKEGEKIITQEEVHLSSPCSKFSVQTV